MPTLKIRMVASDIDGTLLRSDGTISAHTVDMIHAAQERGILFTICSGRFPEHADVLLKPYGIRCPITACNGATQWDARTDTILQNHFIRPESARQVVETAEKNRLDYMIFCTKHISTRNDRVPHSSQRLYGDLLTREYGVIYDTGLDAVREALERPINKFYFQIDDLSHKQRMIEAFRQISEISVTTSGQNNIEIIPLGCDKAGGMREMARLFDIDIEQVMAVGDYDNDVPMLQAAGLGVAMGNAPDHVKKRADQVTLSNNEDGLAKAIEKYVLNQE